MPTPEQEPKKESKLLMRIVIAIALTLLIGTIVLIIFAVGELTSPERKKGCEPMTIDLAGKGQVVKIEEVEKELHVWLKDSPSSINIRHYNMCTGQVLKDVRINADRVP